MLAGMRFENRTITSWQSRDSGTSEVYGAAHRAHRFIA
jgi:hypothetical protein